MTRKNETSPAASRVAPGRAWTAPRLRRMATSTAAFNGSSPTNDGEGFS